MFTKVILDSLFHHLIIYQLPDQDICSFFLNFICKAFLISGMRGSVKTTEIISISARVILCSNH
jgi:hypothetical protein